MTYDFKIIAVATHNERYFNSYMDSFKKYNIEPTILGWGEKYTGHLMKDDLLEEYLSQLNERCVILFTDAFDSILVRNPNELYDKFIQSKKKMIISNEETKESIYNVFQKFFFGTINGELINTGLIIGYSDTFLKCLKKIKKYRLKNINSNQKIWTHAIQNSKYLQKRIYIDKENEYFNNHNICSIDLIMKNNMVYLPKKETYPFVIQFNGNRNLNIIAKELDILESQVETIDSLNYYKNAFYYYGLPYIKYIILIIIIIFLYKKYKQ